jgi:hypothetical protein
VRRTIEALRKVHPATIPDVTQVTEFQLSASRAAVHAGSGVGKALSSAPWGATPLACAGDSLQVRGSTVRVSQRASGSSYSGAVSVVVTGDDRQFRRPSDVQVLDVGGTDVRVTVEGPDCVLASVASEVAE